MEMEGQLHGLASLSPKKDAPGTLRLRGWIGPRAGLHTLRTECLLALSGIEPRFLVFPFLSLVNVPTALVRLHLISGACKAYFSCGRHQFFIQLLNKQILFY
jgi:hypothetical protein